MTDSIIDHPAQSTAETDPQQSPVPAPGGSWGRRFALLLLIIAWCLCTLPWRPQVPAEYQDQLLTRSMSTVAAHRLVELGAAGAYRMVLIGLIGWLAWWALPGRRRGWFVQLCRWMLLGLVIGSTILLRYPSSLGAVSVIPAVAIGGWCYLLARALGRGVGATLSWALGSCVAIAGIAAVLLMSATDVQPTVEGMPAASAEDRDRWKDMLSTPYEGNPQIAQLQLTGDDLTLMASSWLSAQSIEMAAQFQCVGDQLRTRVSIPVHIRWLGLRYLNFAAEQKPSVANGKLNPRLQSLKVGSVRVPTPLVKHASAAVRTALNDDSDIRRVLASVNSVTLAEDKLLVLCEPDRASVAAAETVAASPEASEELRELTRTYMRRLIAEAGNLPVGDERFLGLLRTAMAIARERSTPETAVLETRAALVALGIQIGDPRVRRLAGFPPDEPMPHFKYPFDRKVTLRERNDLARHFFVSAALRALSSEEMTVAVGLIKEHLDSAQGGSGFSFADLSADLAGVKLAQRATADNASAAELQTRMAEPFTVDDLMPAIDGLPEGLTEEMFREQYGSLTDPRFLKLTVEIQQRMKACELLE